MFREIPFGLIEWNHVNIFYKEALNLCAVLKLA